ncbi:PKD domain-containing protein, partial [Winogradskyella immobilis]
MYNFTQVLKNLSVTAKKAFLLKQAFKSVITFMVFALFFMLSNSIGGQSYLQEDNIQQTSTTQYVYSTEDTIDDNEPINYAVVDDSPSYGPVYKSYQAIECYLNVDIGEDVTICDGDEVTLTASVSGESQCQECEIVEESVTIPLDIWEADTRQICNDEFTSTTQDEYEDIVPFDDPILDSTKEVTSIEIQFNVAACYGTEEQNNHSYPIELNGTVIGYFNPTELPCQTDVCESTPPVTYTIDSTIYNYNGSNEIDLNFDTIGAHICVANIDVTLNTEKEVCVDVDSSVSYLWSTGEETESITVDKDGVYSVTVTDCEGCEATDEIEVTVTSLTAEVTTTEARCDSETIKVCDLFDYNGSRTIWLPNFGGSGKTARFSFIENSGKLYQYTDGTAHLVAKAERTDNSNEQVAVSVWLTDRKDWNDWSSESGKTYKNGGGLSDAYLDWDYYVIDDSKPNTITGLLDLAGLQLDLTTRDSRYGVQVGEGANDKDSSFGVSFWFNYTSSTPNFNGRGDFNIGASCAEAESCGATASVSVNGGTPPFVFSWSNGFYGNHIKGLCPGDFSVTITDANGCATTENFTIVESPSPEVTIADIESVCSKDTGNDLALLASSDDDIVSWSWSTNGTAEFSDDSIPNPTVTKVTDDEVLRVTVTDGNGCTASAEITVEVIVCCVPSAECKLPPTRTIACSTEYPDTYRDYNDVFENVESCGGVVTMGVSNTTPVVETTDSGVIKTKIRTYTLYVDGIEIATCTQELIITNNTPIFIGEGDGFSQDDILDIDFDGCMPENNLEFEISEDLFQDCGGSIVSNTYIDSRIINVRGDDCDWYITVRIKAEGFQGPPLIFEQEFHGGDNIAPEISDAGSDITIECTDTPEFTPPTATDNCGEVTIEQVGADVREDGDCANEYRLTRTWKAVDTCGNESGTVSQTITVQDTTGPELIDDCNENEFVIKTSEFPYADCPADAEADVYVGQEITVEGLFTVAGIDLGAPSLNLSLVQCFTDNCSETENLTYRVREVDNGKSDGCDRLITVYIEAIDECGNESVGTLRCQFRIIDDTAPTITQPADITIECTDTPEFTPPTATDNCGEATIEQVGKDIREEGDCPNEYRLTRTWKAEDACGNMSGTVSQTISVIAPEIDVDGPEDIELTQPEDYTTLAELQAAYQAWLAEFVTLEAGCGDEGAFEGEVPSIEDFEICSDINITLTYSANDGCSEDSVTASFKADADNMLTLIEGEDLTPQDLNLDLTGCMPEDDFSLDVERDLFQDCFGNVVNNSRLLLQTAEVTGTDCDWTVTVTITVTGDTDPPLVFTETFQGGDQEAPVITLGEGVAPSGTDFGCSVPPVPTFTATDNCAEGLTADVDFEDTVDGCINTRVYTATASDGCNDAIPVEVVYTWTVDEDSPVISTTSESGELECNARITPPV